MAMINKYNHNDWKEFKMFFKIKNDDVANIIGVNTDSVKNQTQPRNNLPKWAVLAIWVWKKMST